MQPARKMIPVDLFGVPMDLGGNRRGTDMGPSAFRIAGLEERLESIGIAVEDHGDIPVANLERCEMGDPRAKYLASIAEACELLRQEVLSTMGEGRLPLVLGGDHSIALGTLAGVAAFYRQRDASIGLIWVDAHTDMNTPETSPTGNVHGMPLSHILGKGAPALCELGGFSPKVQPQNVALIGIRDVDPSERRIVAESGVTVFTMKEIDQFGMNVVAQKALEVAMKGTAGFHLSFDLDGIDPMVAPGVATPVVGGLTYRESHLLMELVADSRRLVSMEVVEHNPVLDSKNVTAEVGVGMILSALGRRIL